MNPNIVHADNDITSEKMSKSIVEASDICKKYGSKTVLSHISFSIQRSEYVCIVGKSGAMVAAAGIVIEKSFQPGWKRAEEAGLDVCSLVRIASIKDGRVTFLEEDA